MRGEYWLLLISFWLRAELPPRARRILGIFFAVVGVIGTTSACAENTSTTPKVRRLGGNYLRVRGEYTSSKASFSAFVELPPRARRIPDLVSEPQPARGTTSACAENTRPGRMGDAARRNYLRVRGEYATPSSPAKLTVELPPRARRIRNGTIFSFFVCGTTSACAENT